MNGLPFDELERRMRPLQRNVNGEAMFDDVELARCDEEEVRRPCKRAAVSFVESYNKDAPSQRSLGVRGIVALLSLDVRLFGVRRVIASVHRARRCCCASLGARRSRVGERAAAIIDAL